MRQKYWPVLGACVALASAIVACESDEGASPPPIGSGGTAGSSGGGAGRGGDGGSNSAGRGGSGGGGGSSGAAAGTSGGAGASGNGTGGSGTAGASGSAGNGGTTDAGSGGAQGSGPVPCVSPNVCDDFEAYTPGGGFGPWTQNGTSGTLEVDAAHVFSGAQSVHFEVTPGGNRRVQLQRTGAPLFPATNNSFWGRVMVWGTNLPMKSNTEDKNVHFDVIQANSSSEPGEYRVAGMGNVLLNYEPHDCYYGTNKLIPEDRWACWEWLFDGTNNVIEFYIDGQLQARVQSKGQGCVDGTDSVWDAPTFNRLRMGWINYQSMAETTELWMDDFAAGGSRIGCPAPSGQTH
jgi:hypothetical protein